MTEIPKKYKKRFEKLSEKLGKSAEELEKEYLEVVDELMQVDPTMEMDDALQKGFIRWRGMARRESGSLFSPAPVYTGILFGESGLIDFIEVMKAKAKYLYELGGKAREDAISNNIVNRQGIPLDTRETTNFGRDPNPNYALPFPDNETSYYRAAYGVAWKGTEISEESIMFFRYNINEDSAVEAEIPEWGSTVMFRANEKRKQSYGFMDLNAPTTIQGGQHFKEIEVDNLPDVYESLLACMWSPYTTDDLDRAITEYGKDRSVPIVLWASADSIGTEVSDKTGNRTLWLGNPESDFDTPAVAGYISGEIPITFGLDSQVLFVGRPFYLGEGEDKRTVFEIWGFYAPKEYLLL